MCFPVSFVPYPTTVSQVSKSLLFADRFCPSLFKFFSQTHSVPGADKAKRSASVIQAWTRSVFPRGVSSLILRYLLTAFDPCSMPTVLLRSVPAKDTGRPLLGHLWVPVSAMEASLWSCHRCSCLPCGCIPVILWTLYCFSLSTLDAFPCF